MSAKTQPKHCRLSVILATEAGKGVIFRRGPSQWVQLILWDTRTDTFTEGQWFKGNIYPRYSDLSPDGSKLLYFASKFSKYSNHNWHAASYQPAWTAISRPPYFTALALWNEVGTWGGGGFFEDNHTVCLRSATQAHKNHLPPPTLKINPISCERPTDQWLWQMERGGWEAVSKAIRSSYAAFDSAASVTLNEPTTICRKTSPDLRFQLTMSFEGYHHRYYGDPRILTYSVMRKADQKEFLISDTWADWDQQGRLVYAEDGQLFVGTLGTNNLESRLIADFNPNRPQLVKAPEWATTWN